ncbi:hypothetical protein [uncultured Gilvimarinus sp.]|uniref:hypothetical protein n=1 Tax=uncultured Gilvimarinus sp. TaxID=1689143 RepID=UPI0030EF94FD
MKIREKYENGLFTIRFVGEDFNQRGVNIYDLGHSLLAMQRIVHKAFLSQEGRLQKGAFPRKEEREALSLQVGERKRKSDAFALVPVLSDPAVQEAMKELAKYIFSGIVGYYTGNVLDKIHKEKDQDKKIFIGSLYTEVANIVNRIDASGSVEAISLGSPLLERETIASFNSETKEYLNSLKDEYFLGDYQEIKGSVYKLYPSSRIVAIKRAGGSTVSIFLKDEDFNEIRYRRETKPEYLFKGRPKYQFGVETKSVTEFEADAVEYVAKDS